MFKAPCKILNQWDLKGQESRVFGYEMGRKTLNTSPFLKFRFRVSKRSAIRLLSRVNETSKWIPILGKLFYGYFPKGMGFWPRHFRLYGGEREKVKIDFFWRIRTVCFCLKIYYFRFSMIY